MKVQHYQMDMRAVGDMAIGSAILDGDEIIGFVWRWDNNRKLADILLFEPREIAIKPHQKFMASEVEAVMAKFEEVLRLNAKVLPWWKRAAVQINEPPNQN